MAKKFSVVFSFVIGLFLFSITALAGERVLSINGNEQNADWVISGEPSLVMNGFDLAGFGVALPAAIDRVSIAVDSPVPGAQIDVVVYQDANGGSPVDAVLAGRTAVDITQSGVFTAQFSEPVAVTQPAVWVGFYLPVGFEFLADTSGSSVLTYWAWTPGGRFDLANLSSASVLGPADGSAPVNINMGGKARIMVEITGAEGSVVPVSQTVSGGTFNPAYLQQYEGCSALLYDTGDEVTSLRDRINLHCREAVAWQSPAAPQGYTRRGALYDVVIFDAGGVVSGRLDVAVTHCIRPALEDLNSAVIGSAYGSPRTWRILTTQRFGDLICAEVRHGGNLSYFFPG